MQFRSYLTRFRVSAKFKCANESDDFHTHNKSLYGNLSAMKPANLSFLYTGIIFFSPCAPMTSIQLQSQLFKVYLPLPLFLMVYIWMIYYSGHEKKVQSCMISHTTYDHDHHNRCTPGNIMQPKAVQRKMQQAAALYKFSTGWAGSCEIKN
jgi:hypothetical protein